jgi:DNA-directed RNA polymerase specialized sigma24 family protein
MSSDSAKWPSINAGYSDEFGEIDPEVYQSAKELWPIAQRYSILTLGDGPSGLTLMVKAVAAVSRVRSQQPRKILNLKSYLYQTFKHLVLAEIKKQLGHREMESEFVPSSSPLPGTIAEDLDRKILTKEVVLRMNPDMRRVFELLSLGYSFDEIAQVTGSGKGKNVRDRYRRHVQALRHEINKHYPGRM